MAGFFYHEYEYEEEPEYADYIDYEYPGMDEDDLYQGEEDEYSSAPENTMYRLTADELKEYCVLPTLTSTARQVLPLLACSALYALLARGCNLPASARHFLSICFGLTVLYQLFGVRSSLISGQVAVGGLAVAAAGSLVSRRLISALLAAWATSLVCLAYLFICELWLVKAAEWHSMRGAQMIILMKIISLAHDCCSRLASDSDLLQKEPQLISKTSEKNPRKQRESVYDKNSELDDDDFVTNSKAPEHLIGQELRQRRRNRMCSTAVSDSSVSNSIAEEYKKKLPCKTTKELASFWAQSLQFAGYLFHPGTVIFGPWISLETYSQILLPLSMNWWWIAKCSLNLVISCACLLLSTCLTSWIIPNNCNRWVVAYRDALSFRASHYFVCHLSEAMSAMGGVDPGVVARAQYVELPRSLLSVVTWWNVPMHTFLKTYIFETVRRGVPGVWFALLCTYAASAIIHGLNGQLSAVLLSLAVYTYAEYNLRCKLATAFDACVLAKPCRQSPCTKHANADFNATIIINGILSVLCVWHLAYLGVMFDSSASSSTGYTLEHTFAKWRNLSWASHWTVAATLLFSALV